MDTIIIKIPFEPVDDKPGYYWFNKRKCQIISKKVLKESFKNYDNKDIIFLPDQELYP